MREEGKEPEKHCSFCGEKDPIVLIEHHIVPRSRTIEKQRRYRIRKTKPPTIKTDVDDPNNLAILCANCHRRIHHFIRIFPNVHPRTIFRVMVSGFIQKKNLDEIIRKIQYYKRLEQEKAM